MSQFRLSEQDLLNIKAKRSGSSARTALPPTPTTKQRLQALGRLKTGSMNKTETRYALHLEGQKAIGEILWYRFESIKLKLYDNTHATIDFFLMRSNGQLECHDVKGSKAIVEDDALVKMKWVASEFPFKVVMVFPILQKHGGGWEVVEL